MKTSLRIFREHWPQFLAIFLGGLISAAATSVALPFLIRHLVDKGVLGGDLAALYRTSLLALVVVLFGAAVSYLINLRRTRLSHRILKSLNLDMLERYYRLPLRETRLRDGGYFVSRIYDETGRAVGPVVGFFSSTTITAMALLGALGVLLSMSWRMTLLVAATAPLFCWLTNVLGPRLRLLSLETAEREAQTKGVLQRLVAAHPVVNVFGLLAASRKSYQDGLDSQLGFAYQNAKVAQRFTSLTGAMAFSTQLLLLAVSGYEILQGRLTFGGALAISNIYGILLGHANTLLQSIPGFQEARAILERLESFGVQATAKVPSPPRPSADFIQLRGVSFAYDPQRPLYQDFDIQTRPGEKLLLRGPNGCGKSTLAMLMSGLLEQDSGEARTLPVKQVSVGFFPPVFLPGSLRDNVGVDRLGRAGRENFDRLVREMGLEDRQHEDPESFSSGQKQKVAILMALLKPAEVYIFDEPLANVDLASQGRLLDIIFEQTRGKTLIMAMHCDRQIASRFDRCIDLEGPRQGETPAAWSREGAA